VTLDPAEIARNWSQQLPREFARHLATALRDGHEALQALHSSAVLPASAAALRTAVDLVRHGDGPYAAGALVGRLDAFDEQPQVTPVWTGPESDRGQGRLTLAVVADLIDEAQREILLVSYATVPGASIRRAFHSADERGVALTFLLERRADNPGFSGGDDPFQGIAGRRLAWPATARPPGASMHAKVLVVDRQTALVGSANLTGHALERNLECGLLLRGGPVPGLLADHLLTAQGLIDVDNNAAST
jgi:cardiolipin synthase A/B